MNYCKTCFRHNITYGFYRNLTKRSTSVDLLWNKESNITNNPHYEVYQRELASMLFKYFDKSVSWWSYNKNPRSNKPTIN